MFYRLFLLFFVHLFIIFRLFSLMLFLCKPLVTYWDVRQEPVRFHIMIMIVPPAPTCRTVSNEH